MKLLGCCPYLGCWEKIFAIGIVDEPLTIVYLCDNCGYLFYDVNGKIIRSYGEGEKLPKFDKFSSPKHPRELLKHIDKLKKIYT